MALHLPSRELPRYMGLAELINVVWCCAERQPLHPDPILSRPAVISGGIERVPN